MPSASVLFYGRRSRSSRIFDDGSTSSDSNAGNHRLQHGLSYDDPHRRHRHAHVRLPPHPSFLSSIQESELQQVGCAGESSSRDINNRETVGDLSRRLSRNNRLPGPVLLAKERLLERLRSVSVSGARQTTETSPNLHSNYFWVVDADWETNGFIEQTPANTILTESLPEAYHEPTLIKPKKKPLGLSKETLSQLHHEVFIEHLNGKSQLTSKSSNECSICLENFVEGNELVSLPCGHKFHTMCLYPWLQTCGDCPYCRSCIVLLS